MASPRLIKGGIVQVDPTTGKQVGIIGLQYNPETLSRTLQPQATGSDGDGQTQALRLRGAAIETITVDAEIDATDRLEFPDQNSTTVESGIHPQLAALELLVHPRADALQANDSLAGSGSLEVLPIQAPLTLFVWGRNRVVPVRITDLSVTEEAFDAVLNPIRAKVSLSMRVLSVNDLGFDHRGGALFMGYLRGREAMAGKSGSISVDQLGIEEI